MEMNMKKVIYFVSAVFMLSGCGILGYSTFNLKTSYDSGETANTRKTIQTDVTLKGQVRQIGLWFEKLLKVADEEYLGKK
jgi:hypothetical protein